MAKIYVGTSGFNYKHWKDGVFYPKGLAQNKWLEYYSNKFNSLELNVSFYRLPEISTFEKWAVTVPLNFKFAVKGSRYITHVKKLNDVEDSLRLFSDRVAGLSNKASVVLWQFGANFKVDIHKFKIFCNLIRKDKVLKKVRHAFEFRSKTWFSEDLFKEMRANNFCLVIADSKRWPKEEILTANFIYLRFHGNVLFSSNYTNHELNGWAQKIRNWMKGRDLFAYFNNDARGFAPKNALKLKSFLSEKVV